MKNRDQKPGGERPYRDDTPSFLRNVDPHAVLLEEQRRQPSNTIPVFAMPRKYRIWRTIRVPLFVTIILILLAVVGLITRSVTIAKNISSAVAEAQKAESLGTADHLAMATKSLSKLVAKHSDSELAQSAWAWQCVLNALLLGPEEPNLKKATEALEYFEDDDSEAAFAARAGLALVSGNTDEAVKWINEGQKLHGRGPRLTLVAVLTFNAAGRTDDARQQLHGALGKHGNYLPLFMAGILFELKNENHGDALKLSETLLKQSPGHLFASLMSIQLVLPKWGSNHMEIEQIIKLDNKFRRIQPRLRTSPPKTAVFGHYLNGRLSLLKQKANNAVTAFEKYTATGMINSDGLAWHAMAVKTTMSAKDALALLDKHPKVVGKEVLDVRAQCLLEYHRVKTARKVIEKLSKKYNLPARASELKWLLALRSGNVDQALERLPKQLDEKSKWTALELYYQLKHVGHTDGIKTVTNALEGPYPACAKVMKVWHGKNLNRAMRILSASRNEDRCEYAFRPRLMRHQTDVAIVRSSADRIHSETGRNLFFDVDRALAVWHTDGYESGEALLDEIRAYRPEGTPVLSRLASAYLEMEKPKKALSVLGKSEDPELLHLRIKALRAAGKGKKADNLVKKAVQLSQKSTHPALAYYALKASIKKGDLTAVLSWIEDHMSEKLPGAWTSDITFLGAQALYKMDEKKGAEKLFQKHARKVLSFSGTDEFLETLRSQVRFNMKKVGKYKNQALNMAKFIRNERVGDPWLAYFLAVDNIDGGSERIGLRYLTEALEVSPAFRPAFEKMMERGWLTENRRALMAKMRPYMKPN